MLDASALDRPFRQRAAVADLALSALGATDSVRVSEAACAAAAAGLGAEYAAVFERSADGLRLFASALWPAGEPAPTALAASAPGLSRTGEAVPFEGSGRTAHGIASCVGDEPFRLLIAASPQSLPLGAPDLDFFGEVGAILCGAYACVRRGKRLRGSRARASAVLNTSSDGILLTDDQERILGFNPAAERIFGYTAEEVIGESLWMLIPEPYWSYHKRQFRALGRSGAVGIDTGRFGRRRDGSTFPMDLTVSEVETDGGRLFTGIVRDITERRRLEQEVVHVVEEERRRFGQVLHDEIGQMLSGIQLLALDLARSLAADAPHLAPKGEEIATLMYETDTKARMIARGFVLDDITAANLEHMLRGLAQRVSRFFGVPAHFESTGTPGEMSAATATHLYRIAQEAMTNAVRHGSPTEVSVGLTWTDDEVCLTLIDDGCGIPGLSSTPSFPVALPAGTRVGLGFRTMFYRARLMGAHLLFRPVAAGGTEVHCTVPLVYARTVPTEDVPSPV